MAYRDINKRRSYQLEWHRKYRQANKEKLAAYAKMRREKNPDHTKEIEQRRSQSEKRKKWRLEYNKMYYARNRARLLAHNRIYYENNKERIFESVKSWRQNNPLAAKEINRRREAKRRALLSIGVTLTSKEWEIILEFYQWKCAYCGKSSETLTQDHYIPLSKGGHHTADNVVPACLSCNSRKHTRHPYLLF